MGKIRDDLDGVVYVEVEGQRRELKAGDDIPDGVELGDHLIAKEGSDSGTGRRGGRRSAASADAD